MLSSTESELATARRFSYMNNILWTALKCRYSNKRTNTKT